MRHRIIRIIGATLLILVLLTFFSSILFYDEIRSSLQEEIRVYGPIGLVIGGFIVDTIGGPVGPEFPVATGLIAGLPLFMVISMVTLGSIAASLIVYTVGLLLATYEDRAIFSQEQYDKWRHIFIRHRYITLVLAALTPVPYVTVCLLAGVFRVRPWEFILFGIGGRILRVVGSAYIMLFFKGLL